jgi:hypothetical protein
MSQEISQETRDAQAQVLTDFFENAGKYLAIINRNYEVEEIKTIFGYDTANLPSVAQKLASLLVEVETKIQAVLGNTRGFLTVGDGSQPPENPIVAQIKQLELKPGGLLVVQTDDPTLNQQLEMAYGLGEFAINNQIAILILRDHTYAHEFSHEEISKLVADHMHTEDGKQWLESQMPTPAISTT